MANKGLLFEWSIYYLAKQSLPGKPDSLLATAKSNYKLAPNDVKKAASKAINNIQDKYGVIKDISKISGGDEPKTDLIIKAGSRPLKCSLKYGESIQLSSGGVSNTVKFLSGVLNNLRNEEGYDSKKVGQLIKTLSMFEEEYGDIGKLPRTQIDRLMTEAERYDILLKNILGSRGKPSVSEEYAKIKLAIIEEAMTGKYMFRNGIKSADHILTENYIRKIDKKFVKEVADKTSVRLALKGRGKTEIRGKEVRLNEIVVRFDSL